MKPYVSDPEVLTSVASESKIPQVIVPSIQTSIVSNCSILDEFIGNMGVIRLSDLRNSKDDSPTIVIAWYDSVFEGIDMWYPDEKDTNQPRFCLKINVRDEITENIFALFDEEVKRVAFETCGVLASIV
ncbi:hypothetical protein A2U01_0037288, partial [Trifolium medium]|nr:hypothetical protein [Trifolium medium]